MNRSVTLSRPSPTPSAPPQKTHGRSLPPPRYGIALADAPVQRVQVATEDAGSVEAAARHGIGGAGGRLPHLARVQSAFGRHDLSGVVAHTDCAAREGARAMGALAYTYGNHVAFAAPPTLHTVAHEAVHVIQQRAGVRLKSGVGEVGDVYERHADAVADRIVRGERSVEDLLDRQPTGGGGTAVQRAPDWMTNMYHNKRKVGMEITEDRGLADTNRLWDALPTGTWTALAGLAKTAAWTSPVANLPDRTGGRINWRVAPAAGMVPGNFAVGNGAKRVWMVWGDVSLTEDYGDFEWIVRHPAMVQGVTYYRDRLAEVAAARAELRAALPAVPGQYVMAMNDAPGANESLYLTVDALNGASIQVTFESTSAATTKQVLLEGLSTGLDTQTHAVRTRFAAADAAVVTAVNNCAGHIGAIPNVDVGLIAAYIVGDLCHKAAALIDGPGWAGAIAANFKQWRTIFPKSHPTQIMYQAITGPVTVPTITAINAALTGAAANVEAEVETLYATKLLAGHVRTVWNDPAFTAVGMGALPYGVLVNAIARQPVVGGVPTVVNALQTLLNTVSPNFLATEYGRTIAALTDPTLAAHDVVRSTSFATHPGSSRGFAFEDRAEVRTSFPNLTEAYHRLVAVVDRY